MLRISHKLPIYLSSFENENHCNSYLALLFQFTPISLSSLVFLIFLLLFHSLQSTTIFFPFHLNNGVINKQSPHSFRKLLFSPPSPYTALLQSKSLIVSPPNSFLLCLQTRVSEPVSSLVCSASVLLHLHLAPCASLSCVSAPPPMIKSWTAAINNAIIVFQN